jgi:hypothetical protein
LIDPAPPVITTVTQPLHHSPGHDPLLLFVSTGMGIWDLFGGFKALAALITLIFIAGAIFNTWGALNSN